MILQVNGALQLDPLLFSQIPSVNGQNRLGDALGQFRDIVFEGKRYGGLKDGAIGFDFVDFTNDLGIAWWWWAFVIYCDADR